MFEVELGIFSGRPNPHWTLTQRGSDEMVERLKGDRLVLSKPDDADGVLGYRGFVIRAREQRRQAMKALARPEVFRVKSGISRPGNVRFESDLLDSGATEITPEAKGVAFERVHESSINGLTEEQLLQSCG